MFLLIFRSLFHFVKPTHWILSLFVWLRSPCFFWRFSWGVSRQETCGSPRARSGSGLTALVRNLVLGLPASCSASLWWNRLVSLWRANPPMILGQALPKGPHPVLCAWLSVFPVAYKHPKAVYSASVLDDLHSALRGQKTIRIKKLLS